MSGNAKIDDTKSKAHDDESTQECEFSNDVRWLALFSFTTKREISVLSLALLSSLGVGIISPAVSRITGKIFNEFALYSSGSIDHEQFFTNVKDYISYLVLIACLGWLAGTVKLGSWIAFGEFQARNARLKIIHNLFGKEMSWFELAGSAGSARFSRLQSQIRDLQLSLSQPLGTLTTSACTVILSLAQAFYYSWNLTLVTLAGVPPIAFLVIWVGKHSQSSLTNQNKAQTEAHKHLSFAMSVIETVKCYNAQDVESKRFAHAIKNAARWYLRFVHANAIQQGLSVFLSISIFLQGFYYGSFLVRQGRLSVGDVIITFLSAINAFFSLDSILPQILVLERGRAAALSLLNIADSAKTPRKPTNKIIPQSCYGNLKFDNVTFAYPDRPDQPVVNAISMYIPSGKTTYLIGKSGSGKSTIAQLLLRFYTANSGNITFDGIKLELIDRKWLRSHVTLVEQMSVLFSGTIGDNIAMAQSGSRQTSLKEIKKAADFALLRLALDDMPDGLDTNVGERSTALSGGQRQRVALARSRLRDTPVLILDESTSSLDARNRGLMMEAIRAWRRGKTTIIITHDVSQIRRNDYVFVLDRGSMIQEGFRRDLEKVDNPIFQQHLSQDTPSTSPAVSVRCGESSWTTSDESLQTSYSKHSYSEKSSFETKLTKQSHVFSEDIGYELDALPKSWHSGNTDRLRGALPVKSLPRSVGHPDWPDHDTYNSPNKLSRRDNLSTSSLTQLISQSKTAGKKQVGWTDRPYRTSTFHQSGVGMRPHLLSMLLSGTLERLRSRRDHTRPITSAFGASRAPVRGALGVDEGGQKVPSSSLHSIMSSLWPNIRGRQRWALIAGILAATIHGISSPLTSYLLAKLIETYTTPTGDPHLALVYSMLMLAIAVTNAFVTYLYRILFEYTGQCWVDNLRQQAMARILKQPRTFFDKEENKVARLAQTLDHSAGEMRNLLARFCGMVYIAFVIATASVIWAMIVEWKLTLITIGLVPYILLAAKAYTSISSWSEGLSNAAAESINVIFTEIFVNIKTVRAFTLENHFLKKYSSSSNAALKTGLKRSVYTGIFYGLSASAGNFVIALMFYAGASLVKDGSATVGEVLEVFVILIFAITNLGVILTYVPQISSSKDAGSRLLRLAKLPQESFEHQGKRKIASIGEIVLKDLSFSYPSRPNQMVLQGVNLHIPRGKYIAIVGGSGSGKSTLASLLLNLYDTSSTARDVRIADRTISGHDIRTSNSNVLRSLIAIVPQTPAIFPGTILENITYGLPAHCRYSTELSARVAAKQAGIDEFISSLPEGYQTVIGDGGSGLSGGQAQRLTIARALVRQPEVLILDEATSALDATSAGVIRATIQSLTRRSRRATTVLVITHNRMMMEFADSVVVLRQGRIVEQGSYQALIARRGALTELLSDTHDA